MIVICLALATIVADTATLPAALRREVAAIQHPRMRWGDIADVRDAVTQAYALRSWRPLWSVDGQLTAAGRRVLLELDSAATHGLDAVDYDAFPLEAYADAFSRQGNRGVAEFDVMMSVAVARYALALSRGRVDPQVMHPALAVLRDRVDVPAMLDQLSRSSRPDTDLRNLEPHHATYQRLLDLLAQYRRLAASGTGQPADSIPNRILQIQLALERWRWLPHSTTAPWVLVNIPAFRLYALASDQDEMSDMLKMNVVAGRATAHPTPLLVTSIVAVQFHPPWIVPPAIALREIRPLALRDSTFPRRQHYELLRGDTIVPPSRANLLKIGAAVGVRQTPGSWNALGKIKFVTPNGADVFLHDTPERQDFGRARRDLSHGCVRLAAPVALAEFALRGVPEWTVERITDELADTATLVVSLPKPIPVFIVYQTLVPRESGGFLVYPDVYGFDRRLDALLRAGYPLRSPLIP